MDRFVIEIPLGSRSQDRHLGLMQAGVMVVGLFIILPDVRMFRFGLDAGLVIRSAFACLWTSIGLFVSIRAFLFPPLPVSIEFCPNVVRFDSGRAGLRYLGDNDGSNLSRLYRTAFQRRRAWVMERSDLTRASCEVVIKDFRVLVRCEGQSYDLGIGIPDSKRYPVRDALLAWINADPSGAVEHAKRAFSKDQKGAIAH
jgi:hypothetical protein